MVDNENHPEMALFQVSELLYIIYPDYIAITIWLFNIATENHHF